MVWRRLSNSRRALFLRSPLLGSAQNVAVRMSARADYAVRVAIVLAAAGSNAPLKAEAIAHSPDIP